MKPQRLAVIFPAYNEAPVVDQTLRKVRNSLKTVKGLVSTFIVVNDGSTDQTALLAQKSADVVLTHRLNRGLGAAISTGIEYVKRAGDFDYLITYDSDGQHNPKDILKAVKLLNRGFDVVIGSRFLSPNQRFPKMRKTILRLSNLITFLFFHVKTTDSQSGFRAFNQVAFSSIKLSTNRMEVSSEFFAQIKQHNLKFTEMPIIIRYTPYSLQKGQSNTNSLSVLVKLLYRVFN